MPLLFLLLLGIFMLLPVRKLLIFVYNCQKKKGKILIYVLTLSWRNGLRLNRKEEIMKTVKDVSEITGVSIRTLRYYDEIGLLKPTELTEAGYRLYDNKALEKLQEIMFFRELDIPLIDIKKSWKTLIMTRNRLY